MLKEISLLKPFSNFSFFSQQMAIFFHFFAKNEKGEKLPSIHSTVSTTSTSNSCQGRFVINFQGKKVYQSNPKTAIDRSQSTLIIGFEKRVGLLHWTYFGSKGLVCYEKIGHICTLYLLIKENIVQHVFYARFSNIEL